MQQPAAERSFAVGVVILAAGRSSRMGRPKLLLPWGETSVLGHLIWQWRALGAKQIAVVCAADNPAQATPAQMTADVSGRALSASHTPPSDRSIAEVLRTREGRARLSERAVGVGSDLHVLDSPSPTRRARRDAPYPGAAWATRAVVGGCAGAFGVAGSEAAKPAIQAELDRLRFPAQDRIINPAPERGMFSSIQCAAQWPGWEAALTHWALVLGDQPHLRPQTLRQVLDFSASHPTKVCQPARRGHGRHPVLLPRTVFRQLARSTATTLKEFLVARSQEAALCEVDDPGMDVDIDRPEDYAKAIDLAARQRAER
jgi:CTP:molybdopterin cytidylyltransferase MocA